MTAEGTAALLTACAAAAGAAWTVVRSARKDAQLRSASSSTLVLRGYETLVNELQEEVTRLRKDLESERAAVAELRREMDVLRRAIGGA